MTNDKKLTGSFSQNNTITIVMLLWHQTHINWVLPLQSDTAELQWSFRHNLMTHNTTSPSVFLSVHS